jgi:ABC-2 type transport system ATP-binding protein
MSDDVAIKVENVSKTFMLPHDKNTSIKGAVLNFYKRKRSFEAQQVLDNVSFEIKKGEFFGIVGRNGSGKSTLLKLLAGIYSPSQGNIQVNGKLTPFIELGVGFNQELTGRENVFLNGALLGFSRKEVEAMYASIVEFAELEKFMDQRLKNYSSGMQVRLAFSIAIRAESDILLLDEVLAVGDADFQRKCFSYFKTLKKNKRTVVFVSHDMSAVREFCDKGILIDEGQLKYEGPASKVADQYSMLFMTNKLGTSKDSGNGKHIGNGDALIANVKANEVADSIVVHATVKVKKPVEELQYGMHIFTESGVEVLGMNNPMLLLPDIKDLKIGDEINFEWKVLNVFSQGKYYVTLAVADGIGNMLDRYEEADSFSVMRNERSNTVLLPPIKVQVKRKSNSA